MTRIKVACMAFSLLLTGSLACAQTGFTVIVQVSDTLQVPADTAVYLLMINDYIPVEQPLKKASVSEIRKWLSGMGIPAEEPASSGLPKASDEKGSDHELIVKLTDPEKMEAIHAVQAEWGNVSSQLISSVSNQEEVMLKKLTEKLLDRGRKRADILASAWGKQPGKLLQIREVPSPTPFTSGWTIYPPLSALPDFTVPETKVTILLTLELTYELR